MKNIYKVLGIIALVVMVGFSFTACSTGGSGGDGTLMLRITSIPSTVMSDVENGYFNTVIGRANQLSINPDTWLAGVMAGELIPGEAIGEDWTQFYLYELGTDEVYTGVSGNYDIGIINDNNGDVWGAMNIPLKVNEVNTIPFGVFEKY